MGQHLSGAGRKLWSRQPTGEGSRGVATNVVELENERTKRPGSGIRAEKASSDAAAGTSSLNITGGRTRQLSGDTTVLSGAPGKAG